MAVGTFDRVDVVRTFSVFECCVHGLDIDAAVGELRMAGSAGGASRLTMLLVAGEATQAFMDTDGSTVVARADLASRVGRVALITQRLPWIGADLHWACAVIYLRERKTVERDVVLLATVEQGE